MDTALYFVWAELALLTSPTGAVGMGPGVTSGSLLRAWKGSMSSDANRLGTPKSPICKGNP